MHRADAWSALSICTEPEDAEEQLSPSTFIYCLRLSPSYLDAAWDTNYPSLGEACVTHIDAMEALI